MIPYSSIRSLLVDSTLAASKSSGGLRWNFTLSKGTLHVTHSDSHVDVTEFHGVGLITDGVGFDAMDLILANEVNDGSHYQEGAVQSILVNRYERDPRARAACIAYHGTKCHICGMAFASVYGPLMAGFIHVHHLKQLSTVGEGYAVDPIADLRPVCPNCHAVIHRREPPFSIEEVQVMRRPRLG